MVRVDSAVRARPRKEPAMPRTTTRRPGRISATTAALIALVALIATIVGCSALGDSPEERADSDAFATDIQHTLTQRLDVLQV